MVPTPTNFRVHHRLNQLILSWDHLLISDCYREYVFLFNVTLYSDGTLISTTNVSIKSYHIPEQFQSSDYSLVLVAYQPENVDVTSENDTISVSGLGEFLRTVHFHLYHAPYSSCYIIFSSIHTWKSVLRYSYIYI